MSRIILASIFAAVMTGCAVKESYHGASIMIEENLADIRVGSDNQRTVAAKLGSPTLVAPLDQNRWIYVGQQMKTYSFSKPEPQDIKVIEITFDDSGRVADVQQRNKGDYVAFDPDRDRTMTYGRSENMLHELFGNIGRFSPGGDTPEL
jgi:Small protein A (tmRNA-binding)